MIKYNIHSVSRCCDVSIITEEKEEEKEEESTLYICSKHARNPVHDMLEKAVIG